MAAINDYYVDPSIDDTTGSGTVGDPYGDLQHAMDTVTARSGGGADRFNIKTGTAEVLSTWLDFTTYGSPTAAAPIIFQGYSSNQGDGGIGEIDCGGSTTGMITGNRNYCHFIDLDIFDSTSGYVLNLNEQCTVLNCRIYNCVLAVRIGYRSIICACRLASGTQAMANNFVFLNGQGAVLRHTFLEDVNLSSATSQCVLCSNGAGGGNVSGCIFKCEAGHAGRCINITKDGDMIEQCTFWGNGCTGDAIRVESSVLGVISNNIIADFSGTGANGIDFHSSAEVGLFSGNSFYNNTNNFTLPDTAFIRTDNEDNESLSADPYPDPANDDFGPADTDSLRNGALPLNMKFGTPESRYWDRGAMGHPDPAGGAGTKYLFHGSTF